MAQMTGRNLPPPQSPFVDAGTFNLSYDGYQYLLSLLAAAANTQATATVATALKSTGTNQATALLLTSQWNEVDTVAAGTGVLLPAYQPGQSVTVFNADPSNSLNVYPAPGMEIDALGANQPYTIVAGKMQVFNTVSSAQIFSIQV